VITTGVAEATDQRVAAAAEPGGAGATRGGGRPRATERAALGRASTRALRRCIAIASNLGAGDRFDRALSTFAEAYADQNERDHRALADAVAAGRVTAVM
jgi:hypothetical protein